MSNLHEIIQSLEQLCINYDNLTYCELLALKDEFKEAHIGRVGEVYYMTKKLEYDPLIVAFDGMVEIDGVLLHWDTRRREVTNGDVVISISEHLADLMTRVMQDFDFLSIGDETL